jgi:hypothetical protein
MPTLTDKRPAPMLTEDVEEVSPVAGDTTEVSPSEGVPEEVVIEPDLPVADPSPTPAGPTEPEDVPPTPQERYQALVDAMDPSEPRYVAGNRAPRLKVAGYILSPGDVVPGAHAWPRREAWERTGQLVKE